MRTLLCFFLSSSILLSLQAQEEVPLLSPSIHATAVYGNSSADHPGEFAPGGHDPKRSDAFILQSFEPSLSLRWGDYVQGFVTGLAFTDANDDLEWEWEEYFLKFINLPGDIEVRGGRMLSRVGFHNPTHLHSWTTVDAPLPHALFLGEDGLGLEGVDLSFYLGDSQRSVLTLGFGQRPAHDHDHGHGGEDDHDHHDDPHGEEHMDEDHHDEDHHDDDHDHDEHDHEHGGFEAFEAYRVNDDVFTIGFRNDLVFNDFRVLRSNLFAGLGDNEGGTRSSFAGAGVEFQWRENGLEPGGRSFRWRNEVIFFDSNASSHDHGEDDHEEDHHDHDEHGHEEDHDHDHEDHDHDEHGEEGSGVSTWGFSSEILYEARPYFHPFARIDYVGETEELEISDWIRYTLGATFPLQENPGVYFRLQANADERGDESEQSVWAQIGFDWGGPEVR